MKLAGWPPLMMNEVAFLARADVSEQSSKRRGLFLRQTQCLAVVHNSTSVDDGGDKHSVTQTITYRDEVVIRIKANKWSTIIAGARNETQLDARLTRTGR